MGCGNKKSAEAEREVSLFPTTENRIVDGTTVTEVTVEEDITMQAIGGQVIAEFYDTATRADYVALEAFLKEKGALIIGQIPVLSMVQIGASSDDQIVSLIAELKTLPYIEDAYPNMVVASARDPRPAQFTGSSWVDDISIKDAWNISTGKRDVIIGIIDDGIDPNNAQFRKNSIKTLNNFNVGDGHGLGVASVAIAHGDDADVNGTGMDNMVGVCWNCSVVSYDNSIPLQQLDLWMVRGVAKINSGIAEAIHVGARVINVSQAPSKETEFFHKLFRTMLKQSIELARVKNVLLVIGGGNKPIVDDTLFLPGFNSSEYESYWRSNVIVVTGSYRNGTSDSIYGEFVTGKVVDIAAPGLGIGVAAKDDSVIEDWGTSFAAPMVSGTAGLIWSVNPNLSPAEVKAIITDPKNTNPTNNSTIRVLNVYRALSDPRVSGIHINGIALMVMLNGPDKVFALGPMRFTQYGSSLTALLELEKPLPDGSHVAKSAGTVSGNAVHVQFDLQVLSNGMYKGIVAVDGIAQRSTFGTGNLSVDGKQIGLARFDSMPVDKTPPIFSGMGNMGIIRLSPTSGIAQTFSVEQSKENPNIIRLLGTGSGIYVGAGWLNGDQLFTHIIDMRDSANPQVLLLKGTVAEGCGSADGIWETFPFNSDIPIARGTWALVK